jgi:hypothetical protein
MVKQKRLIRIETSLTPKFRMTISARASKKADYIVALAKSKMLEDFGEHGAADAAIKPKDLARWPMDCPSLTSESSRVRCVARKQ